MPSLRLRLRLRLMLRFGLGLGVEVEVEVVVKDNKSDHVKLKNMPILQISLQRNNPNKSKQNPQPTS